MADIELSLSRERVSRLLNGEEVYEILSHRANKYNVGCTYPLYGIKDTYIKVLSNELVNVRLVSDEVWENIGSELSHEEYASKHCGANTWLMGSKVYVLKLVLTDEPIMKPSRMVKGLRKVWVRSVSNEGIFLSKTTRYSVGSVVACSEPYCALVDEYGDWYKDMLCEEYGIKVDSLPKLAGWTNRSATIPSLMPKRVRILASKVVKCWDISEEEWAMMGIIVREDTSGSKRKEAVGLYYWRGNCPIQMYKYELVTNNAFSNGK